MTARCRIAVTLGDPRGIGPEIVADVLQTPPTVPGAEFVVVGPDELVADLPATDRIGVGHWDPGNGEQRAGELTLAAVTTGAELALRGEVDALVTAPADKHAMHVAGSDYPGHTEMLGALAGSDAVMMLAVDQLRVVLVTTHIPLSEVPGRLSRDLVVRTGEIVRSGLKDLFGIAEPRLAVCALNPHAGEQGRFGSEDAEILAPAARALGASGPHPADTVFVRCAKGEFDVVLAPYHDVGMTAVKVAGFGRGVNVTLGLPFVRTSPDHGTAMDIAGAGTADSSSMREAVSLAGSLALRRSAG